MNCASVKWATHMQIVFMIAKMLALLVIIVTGIIRLEQGINVVNRIVNTPLFIFIDCCTTVERDR